MYCFPGFFNFSIDESEQLPQPDSVPHVLDSDWSALEGGFVGGWWCEHLHEILTWTCLPFSSEGEAVSFLYAGFLPQGWPEIWIACAAGLFWCMSGKDFRWGGHSWWFCSVPKISHIVKIYWLILLNQWEHLKNKYQKYMLESIIKCNFMQLVAADVCSFRFGCIKSIQW